MQSTQSQLKLKIWQGSKKNYDRLLTYKELEPGTIYFVGDDATFTTSKTGIIYIAVSKEKAVLFGAFDMAQLSQKVDEIERLLDEANGDIDRLIAEVSWNTEKLATIEEGAEKNKINAIERNGQAITPTEDKVINILIPIKTSELTNDSEYQTSADVAETIIGVDLNIASGIITLTRKNGTTFTIDLPTEKIIKSGYYDSQTEEIVMVLADDSEIRFSASQLIDEYYADNVTLEQYTDTADGNKKKFRLTTSYKNKVDGAEQVSNKTASVTSASTATQYPSALAVWNAIKNFATSVQTFTTASTRANIESGETISAIFGKISKWFADLKAVAFSGSYNDLSDKPSIGNGTITIKQKGVEKGSFSMNQTGNAIIELTDDNTTYGIATSAMAGLIKSGTDIAVDASGNVSVNDNSHNHTISNIALLQSTLDGKLNTSGLAEHARRIYATPNHRNGTNKRYLEICRATIFRLYNYVMYDASFIINGGEIVRAISMRARIMCWKGTSFSLDDIFLRIEQCTEPAAIDLLYAEYVPATSTTDGLVVVYIDTLNNGFANYTVTPLSSVSNFFTFVRNEQNNLSQGVASLPANGGTVIKGSLKAMATHDGDGNIINSTYRKLKDVLEITDSNLATYYNSGTEVLSGISNTIGTILINCNSRIKISAIQMTDIFNGKRVSLIGEFVPSERYSGYSSSVSGGFSSYLYTHRPGSPNSALNSDTVIRGYEDFIYFNGKWYGKGY